MINRNHRGELADQLHIATRRLRRGWITQLAPFELSPHQFRALATLVHNTDHENEPPSGMRVQQIADRLRIAPRSATEVIDLLEDKGLVQRSPDPKDRRAVQVSLTDSGWQLHDQIREQRNAEAEDFFSVLSEEDRAELSRILNELLEAHPRRE